MKNSLSLSLTHWTKQINVAPISNSNFSAHSIHIGNDFQLEIIIDQKVLQFQYCIKIPMKKKIALFNLNDIFNKTASHWVFFSFQQNKTFPSFNSHAKNSDCPKTLLTAHYDDTNNDSSNFFFLETSKCSCVTNCSKILTRVHARSLDGASRFVIAKWLNASIMAVWNWNVTS